MIQFEFVFYLKKKIISSSFNMTEFDPIGRTSPLKMRELYWHDAFILDLSYASLSELKTKNPN